MKWMQAQSAEAAAAKAKAETEAKAEAEAKVEFITRRAVVQWMRRQLAAALRMWLAKLSSQGAVQAVISRALVAYGILSLGTKLAAGWRTWSDAATAKKLRLRSMVLNGLKRTAVAWRSWLCLLGSRTETLVFMEHALATWSQRLLAAGWRSWLSTRDAQQEKRAIAQR